MVKTAAATKAGPFQEQSPWARQAFMQTASFKTQQS